MDKKSFAFIGTTGFLALGLGVAVLGNNIKGFKSTNADLKYTVSLNSSNSYVSGSSKDIEIASGVYTVQFDYTGCSSYSGGHVSIGSGGSITNHDIIHSISSIKMNFEGPLQFRYSYDASKWTEYVNATTGYEYALDSHPYYVELKANGGTVKLDSYVISYTCAVNPDADKPGNSVYQKADTGVWENGEYLIVYEEASNAYIFDGALGTIDSTNNYVLASYNSDGNIEGTDAIDAAVFTVDGSGDNRTIKTSDGYYIGSSKSSNNLACSSSTSYKNNIYCEGDEVCVICDNHHLRFNSADDQARFRYFKSDSYINQQPIHFYKKVAGSNVPSDTVGITASDNGTYTEASIYDIANNLVVTSIGSNGSTKTLTSSQYTYVVRDSNNDVIDSSKAFPSAGVYTVTVSYGSCTPVKISLSVGQYVKPTSVSLTMAKTIFTTAETVDFATNLTADIVYNYSENNVDGISYSQLLEKGFTVELRNPSNAIISDLTQSFGVAGTWTIKATSTLFPSVTKTVNITVNPIHVSSLSLDKATLALKIGEKGTITSTVLPANATNKNVTWSSSSPLIASVANGVVEGLAKGSATITATTVDSEISKSCVVTVSEVNVQSISFESSSETLIIGDSCTLTPIFTPTNASNKECTWTSSDSSVASVTNGVVLAKAAGTAIITATTVDGSKTATCTITVQALPTYKEITIKVSDIPSNYSTSSTITVDGIEFEICNVANSYTKNAMQWKSGSGYITNKTAIKGLAKIVVDSFGTSNYSTTLYQSETSSFGDTLQTIQADKEYNFLSKSQYFKIKATSTAYCSDIHLYYESKPVNPTGISLDYENVTMTQGSTKQLDVTFAPSDCNTNQGITWSSSNTNIATVDSNGLVTVKETATIGSTVRITATSVYNSSYTAYVDITVVEQQADYATVMIYMCGADLESDTNGGGLATGDIAEILKVKNQPDDVNIIIETGGAYRWASTYEISSDNLQRYHVNNRQLVLDESLKNASMGNSSTLQSFLEYGINNYPAEKMSLIYWNHGGALDGVCFDENFSNDDYSDGLTNKECKQAYQNAWNSTGYAGKMDWVGYDACLMAVQDIAEVNSHYFNYMVCSQESESGYGWDYDNWVDDLYSKKTTPTVLKEICDTFIAEQGYYSDQTLSYLNLSKMSTYKTAFESVASKLLSSVITSSGAWSTFKNYVNTCGKFGYYSGYSQYNGGYAYDIFDIGDYIEMLQTYYTSACSSEINALASAFEELIGYSLAGSNAEGNSGLCLFCPISKITGSKNQTQTYYVTDGATAFTNWSSLVLKYY